MDIFTIPDIIGKVLNLISIKDVIHFSRVNKLINEVYISTDCIGKLLIDHHRAQLTKIQLTYDINTKPQTEKKYADKLQYIDYYTTEILANFSHYRTLPLPDEYYVILEMLCYFKIPTINIVDYQTINRARKNFHHRGNNVIPLFYILDICPGNHDLHYMVGNFTLSSGEYISYSPSADHFNFDVEDPISEYCYDQMTYYYGMITCNEKNHDITSVLSGSLESCLDRLFLRVNDDAEYCSNVKSVEDLLLKRTTFG